MSGPWRAEKEWLGQTAYIICGGPSVLRYNLDLLLGHKIIATNSSVFSVFAFADFCIFADSRWWDHYKKRMQDFKGRIVSCSRTSKDGRLLHVNRKNPPGLSDDPGTLSIQYTVATAAIDLAVHLGANKILAIGLDGKYGPDGQTHHHHPHPWAEVRGKWGRHRKQLQSLIDPLKSKGVEMFVTADSAYADLWPAADLGFLLKREAAVA